MVVGGNSRKFGKIQVGRWQCVLKIIIYWEYYFIIIIYFFSLKVQESEGNGANRDLISGSIDGLEEDCKKDYKMDYGHSQFAIPDIFIR